MISICTSWSFFLLECRPLGKLGPLLNALMIAVAAVVVIRRLKYDSAHKPEFRVIRGRGVGSWVTG